MALYLRFDKKHQDVNGMIPLKRGDDWKLRGKLIEKYAQYEADLDLTGQAGATAFFPANPEAQLDQNLFPVTMTILDETAGIVEVDVPASGSPSVAVEEGVGIYATLDLPSRGLVTIPMEKPILEIADRGFDEP